jgi:hypothetical protein
MFRQDNTCPALLFVTHNSRHLMYGAITLYRVLFQTLPLQQLLIMVTGLFQFRSPLLSESRLISFPLGT